jgi:Mg-chelatase subunit ChlD
MKRVVFVIIAALLLAGAALPTKADQPSQVPRKPQVEVVFCLDTTGSMGGLIDAAKKKIWTICNQIAAGTPTPNLKVGLVAYRDRKDEYVTRILDLTDDLDAVYGQLMNFTAAGGGDTPESVNQALHEAVTRIHWGKNPKTLKIIFLVGDAPPHMDYPDDVKYPDTCKLAVERNIIINTIQCGRISGTQEVWEKICHMAEGSYVRIAQNGGPVVHIATPYDSDLARINREMAQSTLVYGSAATQQKSQAKASLAASLPAAVAAERAGYASKSGQNASYDLLDAVKGKKVRLEDLKTEELPPEMRKMTLNERKEHLEKLDQRRQGLLKKAADLDRRRNDFIAKAQAKAHKDGGRDSFDSQVLRIIQRQASRVNLHYDVSEPKKNAK